MRRVTTFLLLWLATACEPAQSPTVDPGPAADPTVAAPTPKPAASVEPPAGPDGAIDEIVFRFQERSVPPDTQRNYTIIATPSSIQKTVYNYDEIMSDERVALTRAEFEALVASLKTHAIALVPDAAAGAACTGGTARSLKLLSKGTTILEGRLERCRSRDTGNLAGNIDELEAELNKRAPHTPEPTL